MNVNDLKPDRGAHRRRTRVGRGIAAGQGKTAGRGQKGQGARGGKQKGAKFEGGQTPYVRRLPFKRGFNNIFKIYYQEVNLGSLAEVAAGTTITADVLQQHGLIRDAAKPVVVLGDGEFNVKLDIHATRFSKSAEAKITAAGGTATRVPLKVVGAKATVKKLRKADLAKL
jgi:large subunit ribosomal protein L15